MSDLNTRPVLNTKDLRARAETRRYAFSPVTLTATTVAAAQQVVAAGETEVVEVSSLCVSNSAGGASEVNFCVVDAGGTPSDANTGVKGLAVGAAQVARLDGAIMLNPGQALYAFSNTADALRVSGWITAYL